MELCDKIKEIRNINNLTQEEFAQIIGVSRQTIVKWESGNSIPDSFNLKIICQKFNVSLNYLFDFKDEKEKKKSLTLICLIIFSFGIILWGIISITIRFINNIETGNSSITIPYEIFLFIFGFIVLIISYIFFIIRHKK